MSGGSREDHLPLIAPLFVPATRPDRFDKAAASSADAVIIDLEDAVAPADKGEARKALSHLSAIGALYFVRINGEGTPWHCDDLDALRTLGIDRVCVPKVASVAVLNAVCENLRRQTRLLVQIETAAGAVDAGSIAAHSAVCQLAFGPADFFMDIGAPPSPEVAGHVLRSLVLASRAAGLALPLDGPCFSVNDHDAIASECASAKANGAGGKLCIHPSQVATVQKAFLPAADELAWARRVVDADRGGEAQLVDGKMIDAPIVARARGLLAQSARFGRPS